MSLDTVLSLEEALVPIDQDWDVFQAMAKLFVDQGPRDLAEIKMALVVEDAAPRETTTGVEAVGMTGNVTWAVRACAKLDTELHRLLAVLRPMPHQGQGPSA